MLRPNFFLRTKLLPPRTASEMLARPRLIVKLQENLDAPMTLVAADAGYGKTTLIADFVRCSSRQFVWYQLDYTDADPFVFLGYLTHGICSFSSGFGKNILPYLEKVSDEFLRFPERAVDLLLNEIFETIEQPFIIVLDDYHHIGRKTVVHKLVDRLLQYSSEIIHLIITTRDLPPLQIMRHRMQSQALVITREDLLFTDEEIRELFRQTLKVELKDEEIAEYHQRTEGWITALQLVRQVAEHEIFAHSNSFKPDLKKILHQSEKDIFDYFAEEVFSRELPETQNILLYLSLLESLPLDVCSRLFPDQRCAAVLPELLQKNVFLTVSGEGQTGEVYRLHPLFRDFLQRRLRSKIGRAGIEAERNRLADFFLQENQWEKALPFLLEAENFEKATQLIAEKGGEWLESGAIMTLDSLIAKIPPKFLEKYPRALLHQAEIARLRGESEKSTKILQKSLKILAREKDSEGEAEALHSLASLARRKGEIETALEYLEKAEKLISTESETYLKCANTRGLCFVGQGRWTLAENQFRLALKLAEAQGNEHFIRLIMHNLALPAGFRGDFGTALRWFKRIFSREEKSETVPQEAIGHLNIARLHLFRGELDEAEKHLERSLEICHIFNLKALRGEIFEAYGNLYREKNDYPHTVEFYERAARSYDEAGIEICNRDLDEERAKFQLHRGDAVKARALLEKLLAERTKTKNEFGIKTARLHLCRVRLFQNDTENLAEEVKELVNFFHEQSLNYDEAIASLLLAEVYFATDRRQEMLVPLQRALDLSARFDYEYWLRGEICRNPQLFADEEVIEKLPLDLRELVKSQMDKVRIPKKEPATVSEQSPTLIDLTIRTFGFVEIFRDKSKPFAPDAWTTRRARDIFCFIATSKHRRVEKDVLIDIFWGEEEPITIEKNFHPTISHIRKALNSWQSFKQNFLIFRDGAYQLNPELVYSIDTEEFEVAIAAAEKAKKEKNSERLRENLEKALEIYRGEYIPGVYENWADERRRFYREQHLRVLTGLSKLAFSSKNWSDALKFANQILHNDPFREDAHRLIMKIYAAQGKRAAVVEQFENLQKLLKKELGITPAPETRRVFQELLK